MIKVCGEIVQNSPKGMENCLDILLDGVVESQYMHYIKTALSVYGRTEDEIIEYANNIRKLDSSYDVVSILSCTDEETGERNFKNFRKLK